MRRQVRTTLVMGAVTWATAGAVTAQEPPKLSGVAVGDSLASVKAAATSPVELVTPGGYVAVTDHGGVPGTLEMRVCGDRIQALHFATQQYRAVDPNTAALGALMNIGFQIADMNAMIPRDTRNDHCDGRTLDAGVICVAVHDDAEVRTRALTDFQRLLATYKSTYGSGVQTRTLADGTVGRFDVNVGGEAVSGALNVVVDARGSSAMTILAVGDPAAPCTDGL